MLQEDARATVFRPGVNYVVGECCACFLQEGHDAITFRLGPTHDHLGLAPTEIAKLKGSKFLVAQSSGGDEEQDGAVAHNRGVQIDPDALPAAAAALRLMLRTVLLQKGELAAENDKLRLLIQRLTATSSVAGPSS